MAAPWYPIPLAARLDRHGGLRCRAQRVPGLEPPRLSACRCERPLSSPSPNPNPDQVWETTVLLWISKLPWLEQRVPPNFEQARATACNHMHASLQPQACEPATACVQACSYKPASLQPHACEPAAMWTPPPHLEHTWSTLGAGHAREPGCVFQDQALGAARAPLDRRARRWVAGSRAGPPE